MDREINLEKLKEIIIKEIHTSNNYTFKRRLSISLFQFPRAVLRSGPQLTERLEEANCLSSLAGTADKRDVKLSLLSRTFG